jgi:hypothetical protein
MSGEKERPTDRLVNGSADRMIYRRTHRLINVISGWIFSCEPIREQQTVPYVFANDVRYGLCEAYKIAVQQRNYSLENSVQNFLSLQQERDRKRVTREKKLLSKLFADFLS